MLPTGRRGAGTGLPDVAVGAGRGRGQVWRAVSRFWAEPPLAGAWWGRPGRGGRRRAGVGPGRSSLRSAEGWPPGCGSVDLEPRRGLCWGTSWEPCTCRRQLEPWVDGAICGGALRALKAGAPPSQLGPAGGTSAPRGGGVQAGTRRVGGARSSRAAGRSPRSQGLHVPASGCLWGGGKNLALAEEEEEVLRGFRVTPPVLGLQFTALGTRWSD